jgi:hypothetical protein
MQQHSRSSYINYTHTAQQRIGHHFAHLHTLPFLGKHCSDHTPVSTRISGLETFHPSSCYPQRNCDYDDPEIKQTLENQPAGRPGDIDKTTCLHSQPSSRQWRRRYHLIAHLRHHSLPNYRYTSTHAYLHLSLCSLALSAHYPLFHGYSLNYRKYTEIIKYSRQLVCPYFSWLSGAWEMPQTYLEPCSQTRPVGKLS